MIRGRYVQGRPFADGLFLLPPASRRHKPTPASIRLLIDTGADSTLILPADYESHGYRYPDFAAYDLGFPLGFGGGTEVRHVPGALYLRHSDGRVDRIILQLEIARPGVQLEGLPSVLGRDVLDLYRLTINRRTNYISLAL